MNHGVQVTKVGKVLRFRHSRWLKPYIDTNTELRTSAKSQFDKGLFKLMVNSVYGKTIENVRKHTDVKIITDPSLSKKLVAKPNFNYRRIYDGNMALFNMKKQRLSLTSLFM